MLLALSDFFKRKKEHLKLPEIQQIIDELAAQVQGPYLSLYEILEWREQLFMAALKPYPPSLSFQKYYTQHSGILGTGITFKSYNLTTISSIAIQATLPQKYSSKYLTKTVEKMAQKVVGSTNLHQSWMKYDHQTHFEVGQQKTLLGQKSKRGCCEIILELFLMKNAFEALKDESDFRRQPYQFNATGKYVYTYIIQSEFLKQDRAKQYVVPLKELQQHEKSKHMNEIVHWNYWSYAIYMLLLKQARDIYIPPQGNQNQYINITQYDIAEYIKKEGHCFKNMTQAQFNDKCQTLLNQYEIQRQKSAQEHRNNYAIITFTDERLLGFVNDFSKYMHYRTRIFQWNSAKFMKVKDFYQKWGMLKHDKKAFKEQIIKKQLLAQEEKKMRTEVLKISVGQYFEILSEIIEESPVYREILYGDQMYPPYFDLIQQKLKRDNQNGIPIKQNNKVDASPLPKNETYLEQNDRLIKDSQKRVEMLSCWKELMVQCKYRCKVGANCQCRVNRRQLQSEERYLQKLYKYRDYYQSSQSQKKTLFPKISNENQSPTQIKDTIVEPLSTKVESSSVQPLKKVENGSPRLNQKKKKHKEGGDFQWNRLKLKRTICDYDEQELNLMNMLDHMNLGEYRAPCNLEESKADIWKKMGEKYRKNSQNRNKSKKK